MPSVRNLLFLAEFMQTAFYGRAEEAKRKHEILTNEYVLALSRFFYNTVFSQKPIKYLLFSFFAFIAMQLSVSIQSCVSKAYSTNSSYNKWKWTFSIFLIIIKNKKQYLINRYIHNNSENKLRDSLKYSTIKDFD